MNIYKRTETLPGMTFQGPAVVTQDDCTTVIPEGMLARIDEHANLRIVPEHVR